MKNKPAINIHFNFRRFISCCEMFLFIIIVTSGIALFIAPSTRIATSEGWRFLELTKFQWQTLHIIASVLFLFFGLIHLYYNRKALKNYIASKHLRFEFIASIIIGIIISLAAIKNISPVSKIMSLNWKFRHPSVVNSHGGRGYYFKHRRF